MEVLTIKVGIPFLKVLMKEKLEEVKWIEIFYDQFNFIEEKDLCCTILWTIASNDNDITKKYSLNCSNKKTCY